MQKSLVIALLFPVISLAHGLKVKVFSTDNNTPIGYVTFKDTKWGLRITPHLKDLPAGEHGFHIHQAASCDDHGNAAGGHLDPTQTDKHLGPEGQGHLGDLPFLTVESDGTTSPKALLAPHLKVSDLRGHSVMVHADGDNYSDTPLPLGGGGKRLACGVIKA